jgi:hypothetical protein
MEFCFGTGVKMYEEVYEAVKNWLNRVMIECSKCIAFETLDDTPDCLTVNMETEHYIAQLNVSRPEFRPYRFVELYVLDSDMDIHAEPVFVFRDSENETVSDVINGLNRGIDLITGRK